MLILYRRHTKSCPHRAQGRAYRRCKCPIWIDGTWDGREVRKALQDGNGNGFTDWQRASDFVQAWEATGEPPKPRQADKTIAGAWEIFESDAMARSLSPATMAKYGVLRKQMEAFAKDKGLTHIKEWTLDWARKFRETWPDAALAASKKLERMKAFFRFCHESGWLPENPAAKLKPPKVERIPTLPFSQQEVIAVFAACETKYLDNYGRAGQPFAKRLLALCYVLRYSGLRIGDAVSLRRSRVQGDRLMLYTAKTGTPVYLPLPPEVITALTTCPATSDEYYFWSGNGLLKSAVSDWQRSLRKLFRQAGVEKGHAHRFRDTFAVELLKSGVPIERVSILLGHSDPKITWKHYAPWVKSLQERLEEDVRKTWTGEKKPIDKSNMLDYCKVVSQ